MRELRSATPKKPDPYKELTGLTLPDALDRLEPDTLVYLGATASFLEITTAAELRSGDALERLDAEFRKSPKRGAKYKPLRNRIVREAYARTVFGPGAILLAEGKKFGQYWCEEDKQNV